MNLIEGLRQEQQRVRELIPLYKSVPFGSFTVALIEAAITAADEAITADDTVRMVRVLKELQGFKE